MGADEETTRPLRVALMEADLSSSQQSLLRKHCPSDVEAQKKELTELLLTYQGHLSLLYKMNTEDKTDGTCTSLLPHLLASVPILGGTTRLTRYERPSDALATSALSTRGCLTPVSRRQTTNM